MMGKYRTNHYRCIFRIFFFEVQFRKILVGTCWKNAGSLQFVTRLFGFFKPVRRENSCTSDFFLSWYLAAQEFQTILVRSCWVPLENIQFGKTSIQLTFWDGRVGQYRVWEMSIYIARISWMIFHDVPLLKYAKLGHGEISHRLVWTWGISRYPKKNDGESMLVSHHVPQ